MRRRSALHGSVAVAAGALIVTGCVGSVPRGEFEADLRERGGGITGEQMEIAVELAAAEAAVTDPAALEVLNLRADALSRVIVLQPRRGDQPEFVDNVVVRDDEVLSADPVQDADAFDLDALVIPVSDVPLADAAEYIDRAIVEFGDPDTVVSSYQVARRDGSPVVVVEVASPRRTGSVVFAVDGSVIEVAS